MNERPVLSSRPAESSSKTAEPRPGFWPSVFGAAEAVSATREFSELQATDYGLFWLEYDPIRAIQGLRRWLPEAGERLDPECPAGHIQRIGPADQSLRSRVNEYGGGSYCVGACAGSGAVFMVHEGDQQIYRQALIHSGNHSNSDDAASATTRGPAQALTHAPGCRFGDLYFDRAHQRILCVRETHADAVTQDLVAIDPITGALTVFASGADFYASPRVDPEGSRAAWIEWSLGDMPWDSTRLAECTLESAAAPVASAVRYLEPESADAHSILQPRFDASGQLWCLSDHHGWWQLYRLDPGGDWVCIDPEDADSALPPSQLGHQQYAFLPGEKLALTKLRRGWMHLELRRSPSSPGQALLPDYSLFRYLQVYRGRLCCIAGSPDRATAVVIVDPGTGAASVLTGGEEVLPVAEVARPHAFSHGTNAETRGHGFFYPPCNARVASDRPAPLVIMTHGGPTGATYAVLNPQIQFWTQRGFAVADLNYRGSSGFGRAYRQALFQRWGLSDVEDVLGALDALAVLGWCDTGRAFIRGSSAGGFTTLSVLMAASDRFLGGCSLYGVSDPWALRFVTHRFESRYLDWLIAPASDPETFQSRSPLAQAKRITAPVIFFQGGRDEVVVPEQTVSMVAALQAEGRQAAYHYYPDEGHGFRQPGNRQHALEQELAFFQALLDYLLD